MSKLAVKLSPDAFRELSDIMTFLTKEADPHFARRQIERLKRAINQLRGFPDMGVLSLSALGPYRQWFVATYVIFYVSDETQLSILHILPEAQVPSIYLKTEASPAA
jgi:plasmid stabilization system protein ParE